MIDSRAFEFALWADLVLAGFILFPAVIGLATWNRSRRDPLWVGSVAWSLCIAASLIAQVLVLWWRTPASWRVPALDVRHVLTAIGVFLFALMFYLIIGRVAIVVLSILTSILVVRAVLWFTTDLFFAHHFDAAGLPVYGPFQGLFVLLVLGFGVGAVLIATFRSTEATPFERRALLVSVLPTAAVAALTVFATGATREYFQGLVLVPGVITLDLLVFARFRRQSLRPGAIGAGPAVLRGR